MNISIYKPISNYYFKLFIKSYCVTDSTHQHVISTSLVNPVVYQSIAIQDKKGYIDEVPSPSIDEEIDDFDDLSDDEHEDLFGFAKNDATIMLGINRSLDLKCFSRYEYRPEYYWYPSPSETTKRKRNHSEVEKPTMKTFASDRSIYATPQGVPKRRRCQKSEK